MSDLTNWRKRRLEACRAVGTLRDVVGALGVEDGTVGAPERGEERRFRTTSVHARALMMKQLDLMLEQILMFNDGDAV